jgi:hypothetical protein
LVDPLPKEETCPTLQPQLLDQCANGG